MRLDTVAAGLTGTGVTIAVIDGQINPDVPTLAGSDLRVQPSFCIGESGPGEAVTTELSPTKPTDHGTNVASMILGTGAGYDGQQGVVGVAPGATVLYYSVYDTGQTGQSGEGIDCAGPEGLNIGPAIEDAIDQGADIISVSLSVGARPIEVAAFARAFREGVIIVGSLSNSSKLELTGMMPGSANGTVAVQSAGLDATVQMTDGKENANVYTTVVAPGRDIAIQGNRATGLWTEQFTTEGTSLATPLTAGVLALVMEKYPQATGNQIIQSLIRNTSGDPDGEPTYDPANVMGYGFLSPANMLSVDPTKYEDVNPLIENNPDAYLVPSYDEIFSPTDEPTDAAAGDAGSDAPAAPAPDWLGLVVWVVLGGLVLVAGVVVIVIFAVRKRAAPKQ